MDRLKGNTSVINAPFICNMISGEYITKVGLHSKQEVIEHLTAMMEMQEKHPPFKTKNYKLYHNGKEVLEWQKVNTGILSQLEQYLLSIE